MPPEATEQRKLAGIMFTDMVGYSALYCAREKLANTIRLIFMPEPYPCYPFNPWFF